MYPFEIAREFVAGTLGGLAVLVAHYGLDMPYWNVPDLDLALAGFTGVLLYSGIRLVWTTRPGLIERLLGIDPGLRFEDTSDDPESLRAALRHTIDTAAAQVSDRVRQPLGRIDRAIDTVLGSSLADSAGRQARYTVSATIHRYLPDVLESYLELPEEIAVGQSSRDGKTPEDMTIEQLEILADEMESILEDLHAGKVRDLSAHGRFLEERFNRADTLKGG